MLRLRVEDYAKNVIHRRPQRPVLYVRHWGAVGDFYYLLTFIGPFLRLKADRRRVLAADVYMRYRARPVLELCRATGLVDELWTHGRRNAGPTVAPQEYVDQAVHPEPDVELYTPGVYYSKYLSGPGVREYPLEWLRSQMADGGRRLLSVPPKESMVNRFHLPQGYVTVQPFTSGKHKRNQIPGRVLEFLPRASVPLVVLQFPGDVRHSAVFEDLGRQGYRVVRVSGPVESLAVQAHALCHVGVESSQLLGAVIQGVSALFFPFGGYPAFEKDLRVGDLWEPLPWDEAPVEVVHRLEVLVDDRMARV